MKKTQREPNRTDSSKTFYSARGVTLLLSVVLILAGLHLVRGKKEPLPPADEDYRDYGDQK